VNSIEDRVIAAIAQALVVDRSQVVPGASLVEDLHGDSLNLIEMIMILEEDFRIEIPDEDAEAIVTVQQAIDYVAAKARQSP
jgi:acyl carrier protein